MAAPVDEHKLLEAAEARECAGFSALVAKMDRRSMTELLQGMSRKSVIQLCTSLERHALAASATLQAVQAGEASPADAPDAASKASLMLRQLAVLCSDLVEQLKEGAPEALQRLASQLHDGALLVLGDRADVQDAVSRMCCTWWELQAPGKEDLVTQTLPYLLIRALDTARPGEVKACAAMRTALALLDFDDPSCADLKRLLLRCAMHPAFLHRPEGRKFVAYLFTLHTQMVQELTAVLRNQVLSSRKSVLTAYGDVLLRGWREATGPCLHQLEAFTIQGLMTAAIGASTTALLTSLRTVLRVFVDAAKKGVSGVDAMLLRLYQPILFRAFAAANGAVRRNALELLLDAFPLADPNASIEDSDRLMSRQFAILTDCLTDAAPAVRCVAVAGVASILNLWWELIPAPVTATYVSRLTNELAYDMASPAVRTAVVDGLRLLVDNPHAQPVLKKALPNLAALVTDPHPKVREAMADLLVAVSTCRSLHFYEVVPLAELLQVMAVDAPAVSARVQSILLPSYFPGPEEGAARVAALLKANPAAGHTFCQYLVSPWTGELGGSLPAVYRPAVAIEHVFMLACELTDHLLANAASVAPSAPHKERPPKKAKGAAAAAAGGGGGGKASGKRRKQQAAADEEAAGGDIDDGDDGADDGAARVVDEEGLSEAAWVAILGGLLKLCGGLAAAVDQGALPEEVVQDTFTGEVLAALLEACPTAAARAHVLSIAERLPFLRAAEALRAFCFKQVAPVSQALSAALAAQDADAADAVAEAQAQLTTLVACLVASPVGTKLIAMVASALGARPPGGAASTSRGGRGGGAAPANPPRPEDDGGNDELRCWACCAAQPEENMLLCDGCDAALHTHCATPALAAVPNGHWFCAPCQHDVDTTPLTPAEAVRCLAVVEQLPAGRQLLISQPALGAQLMALLRCAVEQQLGRLAQGRGAVGADEARDACAALAAYCKAPLHAALLRKVHARSVAEHGADDDEEEDAADVEMDEEQPAARGGKRGGSAAAAAASNLDAKVAAAEQQAHEAGKEAVAAVLHALQQAQAVLAAVAAAATAAPPSRVRAACDVLAQAVAVLLDAVQLQVLDLSASSDCLAAVVALASSAVEVAVGALAGGEEDFGAVAAAGLPKTVQLVRMLVAGCRAAPHVQADVGSLVARLVGALAVDCAGGGGGAVPSLRSELQPLLGMLLDRTCPLRARAWLAPLVAQLKAANVEARDGDEDEDEDEEDAENRDPSGGGGSAAEAITGSGPAVALAKLTVSVARFKKATGVLVDGLVGAACDLWLGGSAAAVGAMVALLGMLAAGGSSGAAAGGNVAGEAAGSKRAAAAGRKAGANGPAATRQLLSSGAAAELARLCGDVQAAGAADASAAALAGRLQSILAA